MSGNLSRAWRFLLERWVQKGVLHQLMLMTALVALVALMGGLIGWIATEQFATAPEAVWWAFLRLTDPGYLGDDEGVVLRVVSTAVTVLGYVIFMGSLIAIMTQGLARMLRNLESGLTPISMKEHIVVLGWTNRTPEIVLKLLGARGRLERFLEQLDVRKLRVVVLSDRVDVERRLELREYLGEHWSDSQVFLRSGSSLQPDHLRRLDLPRASTVVVPGADFELGGAEASDTRVVKTLLTLNNLLQGAGAARPHVVAEIFDPLKLPLALRCVDERVEVVASNRVISRLVSQSIRHRGLAQVLLSILSHREGNSIYVRGFPELAGRTVETLHDAFPQAILLGFVRSDGAGRRTHLDPRSAATLREDDLLVLLAETFERCAPRADGAQAPALARRDPPGQPEALDLCRVLVLGWSHKIGALALELQECNSRFELTIMSRVTIEERERWFKRVTLSGDGVRIQHVEGDYALQGDMAQLDLNGFDNVVFLSSDFMASSEQADARTVLGYVLLRSVLATLAHPPEVLIELLDPDNEHLFSGGDAAGRDVQLVTPRVLSYLLAHVALRPELNSAFDELFCAGGHEIGLRSADELGLTGQELSFRELQRAVLEVGMIALGIFTGAGGLELNPTRDRRSVLSATDRVVVLAAQQS